jgi:hypothetical protein
LDLLQGELGNLEEAHEQQRRDLKNTIEVNSITAEEREALAQECAAHARDVADLQSQLEEVRQQLAAQTALAESRAAECARLAQALSDCEHALSESRDEMNRLIRDSAADRQAVQDLQAHLSMQRDRLENSVQRESERSQKTSQRLLAADKLASLLVTKGAQADVPAVTPGNAGPTPLSPGAAPPTERGLDSPPRRMPPTTPSNAMATPRGNAATLLLAAHANSQRAPTVKSPPVLENLALSSAPSAQVSPTGTVPPMSAALASRLRSLVGAPAGAQASSNSVNAAVAALAARPPPVPLFGGSAPAAASILSPSSSTSSLASVKSLASGIGRASPLLSSLMNAHPK